MASIGSGWVDGAWVQAGWVTGAWAAVAVAANYYVANAGDDTADGLTTPTPWKTIAKVNAATLAAGSNVYFNKGDEWWETLISPSAGSSGSPITFGAYGTGADPIVNSVNAYRYNHRDTAEYELNGLAHNYTAGYAQNGLFTEYTGDDFDLIGEAVTGTGTVTVETSEGFPAAVLFDGTGYAQLGWTWYLVKDQKYEVTMEVKSDGTGTAWARFFQAANGLADTKTAGVYDTWTGTANITDLHIDAADTTWTTKTAIVQVDSSNHPVSFQIRTEVAGQTVRIRKVRVRPLWLNFSGDTWMAGHESSQTSSIFMAAFDGVPTIPAADAASVDATNRWAVVNVGTVHDSILYINSPSGDPGASSENIDITTTTDSRAFDGNAKAYTTCDSIDFRNGYAVSGNFGANTTIQNSTLSVGVYAALITADNFTLDNSIAQYGDWIINIGATTGCTIKNGTIRHAKKYAVSVTGGEGGCLAPSVVTGDCIGLLVENNTIHDADAYGIAEFGTDASNRLENAIYRRNTIYDCWFGIWTQSLANGVSNSQIHYNLIHTPKASGDAVGGGSIATSTGYLHYRAGNTVQFYNNTIVGYDAGIRLWNGATSLDAQNNIVAESINYHTRSTDAGWTFGTVGTNLYFSSVTPVWNLEGTDYATLALWQAAVEASALEGNPIFTDSGNDDYNIQSSSPAVNAGVDVSLIIDILGNAITGLPDIGAYENQGGGTRRQRQIKSLTRARRRRR